MGNDLASALGRFCLGLEQLRRTPEGRVAGSKELLAHFFPHDANTAEDRLFCHMPREVRGPILAEWKIRGPKSALRDDDAKVKATVHDALLAGDLTHDGFEQGLSPETLVRWAPFDAWWSFWRKGRLGSAVVKTTLSSAYDLGLFDAPWLFDTIELAGLRGTNALAEGLTKAELTAWVKHVHESGDASPRGMLAALGWETIVRRTPSPSLVRVIDVLAQKLGLAKEIPEPSTGASLVPPGELVVAAGEDLETTVVTKGTDPTSLVRGAGEAAK